MFRDLVNGLAPGYQHKSARTIKRHILQIYVVLKLMIIALLTESELSRFTLTFDGWSNPSLKGFTSVTLHWMPYATMKMSNCVLDFFYVAPGHHVSRRVYDHIMDTLHAFMIGQRLLAIVTDNGADAVAAGKLIARKILEFHGVTVYPLRCIVHNFELGVKNVFQDLRSMITAIRDVFDFVRCSKVRRAAFRKFCVAAFGKSYEPPTLDSKTRWSSTYHLLLRMIALKKPFVNLLNDDDFNRDDSSSAPMEISTRDWAICHKLCAFLEVPSKINEELCGQDYPTISLAIPASDAMLMHCTKYANDQDETLNNAVVITRGRSSQQAVIGIYTE